MYSIKDMIKIYVKGKQALVLLFRCAERYT